MRVGLVWRCKSFFSILSVEYSSKFDIRNDSSEPLEIRNDRVMIFFECITIFGLFFMSAAWAFYEWSLFYVPEYSLFLENILEVCFSVALSCSSVLALLGCGGWIFSTSLSSNVSVLNYVCLSCTLL